MYITSCKYCKALYIITKTGLSENNNILSQNISDGREKTKSES